MENIPAMHPVTNEPFAGYVEHWMGEAIKKVAVYGPYRIGEIPDDGDPVTIRTLPMKCDKPGVELYSRKAKVVNGEVEWGDHDEHEGYSLDSETN